LRFEAQSDRPRGEEHATSFLRKGVVGDWRGKLSPDELRVLAEAAGPLMHRHGYV
jgi:hypothetical protein